MPKKEVFSLELNVGANITQARNAATQLRDAFAKINLTDSLKGSLEKTFTNLEKELANFEGMANKPFTNMKDVQKAEKSYERIVDLFNELSIQGKNISGMDPNKFLPKEIINRINTLQTSLKSVRTTINNTNKAIESQNREYNQASQQQINYQNKIKETEGAIKSYQGSLSATTKALNDTQKKQSELTQKQQEYLDNGGKKSDPQYQQLGRELSALQKQYAGLSSTQNSYRKQIGELKADLNGYVASEKAAGESAQEHKEQVDKLKQSLQNPQGLTELREEISKLSGIPLDQITTDTDELEKEITKLGQAQLKQISEDLKLVGDKSKDISNTANSVGDLDKKVDELGNDAGKLTETAAEIERLGNQVKQFFSIGNTIQLFKRAVRDAMNTVKELDATMTETATVTNYSISDMWEQLPKYTEEANKLGTSINSLYKATTLYYQQGLETNEAMALGIETIKMARVANMDAALATDLMTAALRGFNMELNEMSAVRINDVYSELAAVTAADTDEIGIAISKTASIAHSANMEFETTAAFLSQIIETTREAPETAGTAMKTIIARFSEVKKLYSEGQILGTDEEGEAINVNKIQEALRTVGIDMTKFFVGAEGLDDVLLRLAEKWDTLDVATQRYIATQAAGSRQQSRFLAMMSDYDRTLQLVDAAYDSAGSGQAQFEKTLDSMQAKLAELKNAWDQFVMGIANSDFLKAGIDALTNVVSVINKILNAISGGNGLIKSIASLGASFLALRGGAKLFGENGFIGKILSVFTGTTGKKEGEKAGKILASAVSTGLKNTLSGKGGEKGIFSAFKEVFTNKTGGIGEAVKGFFNGDTWKAFTAKNIIPTKEDLLWNVLENKQGKFNNLNLDPGIIANNLNDGNIDAAWSEFRKQIEESGESFDQFEEKIKKSPTQIKASALKISSTFAGVGVAFQVLGKIIGDNVVGDIVSTLGTVATTIGALIPTVMTLGDAFLGAGTSAKIAGWIAQSGWVWLIGITAAIGAIMGLMEFTPEKQLERAQKKAEEAQKAAQEAQQAYDDLLNNKNNYTELEDKIKSLTVGTEEWKDSVAELNDLVLELVQNLEGVELEYDENGKPSIKNWDELEKQSKEKRDSTLYESLTANLEADRKSEKAAQSQNVQRIVELEGEKNRLQYEEMEGQGTNNSERIKQIDNELKALREGYSKSVNNTSKKIKTDTKNLFLAFMPDEAVEEGIANEYASVLTEIFTATGQKAEDIDQADLVSKLIGNSNLFENLTDEEIALLTGDFSKISTDTEIPLSDGLKALAKDFDIPIDKLQDFIDLQNKANAESFTQTRNNIRHAAGFTSEDADKIIDRYGRDISTKLGDNMSQMSAVSARNYLATWEKIFRDNGKEVAEALLDFDVTDFKSLTNLTDYMHEQGLDTNFAEDYWHAMVNGAENFTITYDQIASWSESIRENMKGTIELIDRLENGKLSADDLKTLQNAGLNTDNRLLTPDGYKVFGIDSQEARRALNQANADKAQRDLDTLKNFDPTDFDVRNQRDVEYAEKLLNLTRQKDETDEEYAQRIKETWEENLRIAEETNDYAQASVYTADEMAARGGTAQQIRYSTMQEASDAGLDVDELITYSEKLQELYGIEQSMADRIALDNMKMNASIKELADNWDEWGEALKNPDAGDYASTIAALQKNMKQLLGISSDLSEDFLTDAKNMELMAKAADGDTEAIEKLRKAAAENIALSVGVDKNSASEVQDQISNFIDSAEYDDLIIGARLEDTSMIEGLNQMLAEGKLTVEQMNAILEGIGWEPEITYAEMPLDDVVDFSGSQSQEIMIPHYDPITGAIDRYDKSTYKASQSGGMSGATMVRVPIIGSQAVKASKAGYKIGTTGSFKGPTKSTVNSTNTNKGGKKGGGGGSKSDKKNDWKNPYDKYYNLTEKINEALRTREKIERDYDRILKRRERSVSEILKNSQAEIDNLKQEIQYQKQLQAGRRDQLKNVANEKYDDDGTLRSFKDMGVTKYATYNFDEQRIEIDWEAIDKVRDERIGKAIEAYVSRLEELQDQYEETQTTIEEMEDNIWEINQRGKQEYLDLEQRVIDALVNEQQKIIDDLSAKFEGINEANDNILNSMQEQIDLERQIRDNTKTEDDIAQKEARLAYLRRDTSGANATEIMKLEQDLADARQNYTDTLIDQGLQKLSDENAKAAEQRQLQIDVMQAQLNYQKEVGGFNEQAATILASAFDEKGNLKNNSALVTLLKSDENFAALTEFGKENWWTQLEEAVKSAVEGGSNFAKEKYNSKNNTLKVNGANGEANIYWDKNKNAWVDVQGNTYDSVNTVSGTYGSMTAAPTIPSSSGKSDSSTSTPATPANTYPYGKASETTGNISKGSKNTAAVKAIQYALQKLGYNIGSTGIDGKFGTNTENAVKKFQKDMGLKQDGIVGKNTRDKFKTKGYATGGLADFTGPAWLDGTKAHPELVLNARDTENFIQLKDILSGMGSLDKLQNGGDNYYNFDIKVDQLASDYDVDKLIGKIKNEIDKDARYRNVNSINFIR